MPIAIIHSLLPLIMEKTLFVFNHVWLADDDPDDSEDFKNAINEIAPSALVTLLSDGEELMKLFAAGLTPDILFLDINMPCKDGLDCLKEIRVERHLQKLPIVIFSSTRENRFVDVTYGYGANLFYKKPASFSSLVNDLKNILALNWTEPFEITQQHFRNDKYVDFAS
jgi:DNA-binding NarL/FixJ family response regulator